ncbi:peptidase M76 [Radiomyces spectabilis]|uniref:peptidase M76 n=1 Tax=Radiomyces spectabilis TaxID=64574 RepID=UPI00221EE998|nr:peptidase M76 [Radiomyces spectabilis]KAI8371712.1 peptidase M76 [Radiomyces spectabilis]
MRLYELPTRPPLGERECTTELARLLETSPRIAILLNSIAALNKGALRRGITCRSCAGTQQQTRMGYYDGNYKRVVICCENIRSREDLEETVIHELVHAFDATRKGKFNSICHLIACGEVRASALAQCVNIKSKDKKRECILRDAIRSTQQHCGSAAEAIVREVYEGCLKDYAPFSSNAS